MSDEFRLTFSGEVVAGQHPAVVKQRLGKLLKLDDERTAILFSGKPVVVKKSADAAMAQRYREAFEKAGALLSVESLTAPPAAAEPAAEVPANVSGDGAMQVLPAGSDVLADHERPAQPEQDIDTSHLKVQGAVFMTDEPEPTVDAPNVDHLSLAEAGTDLGPPNTTPELEIDVDFDLAEPGADMQADTPAPPPVAPDTSHLQIEEQPKE